MNANMKKRALALLLVLTMCFSLLPTSALADAPQDTAEEAAGEIPGEIPDETNGETTGETTGETADEITGEAQVETRGLSRGLTRSARGLQQDDGGNWYINMPVSDTDTLDLSDYSSEFTL